MSTHPRPRNPVATPHGAIHHPPAAGVQIAVTFAAFAASIGLGSLLDSAMRLESFGARFFAQAPFLVTFILGYALWMARVRALVFHTVGKGLLKALIIMLLRKRAPQRVEDVLPSREKLLEMLVRAQKAASSFALVAAPIGLLSALGMALFDATPAAGGRATVVGTLCLLWGVLLSVLGRRGLLPIGEEE